MSWLEDRREIEMGSLWRAQCLVHDQSIRSTHHLVDGSETKLGHDLSKLFDDIVEEVDDLFWLTGELGSQSWILGGDTDGASVLVTRLHHDATHSNERGGSETPFFRTKKRGNSDISTGSNLTIGLDGDSASKIVKDQGLVGLGKTKLPR